MTALEQRTIEHWRQAFDDLGFRFEAPFTLEDAGETLRYLGWLPQFGGQYGMLIITSESLEEQQRLMDAARARGFGYSCMSASDEPYDREVTIDVLNDWGWASSEPVPTWYTPSPDCHV
jgi:hypothetical protein